jgi:hypothetical protein
MRAAALAMTELRTEGIHHVAVGPDGRPRPIEIQDHNRRDRRNPCHRRSLAPTSGMKANLR